jgi:hypothetical protein
VAARYPSDVLTQVATRIAAITSETPNGGFKRSGYRFKLDKDPVSGTDGTFFVDMATMDPLRRDWGAAENRTWSDITVQVSYHRGGGDLNEGDRQSVLRNAADDCQRIADVLEHPDFYAAPTSGISEVRFAGFSRVADLPRAEIWEVRFRMMWRSDMVTA